MIWHHHDFRAGFGAVRRALLLVLVALGVLGMRSVAVLAQQSNPAPALVFDGVTVIDVQEGRRIPEQRVVIVGKRIQAVGSMDAVRIPAGAQVVDARGRYLIPGLWDMHTHAYSETDGNHPLFIANGVTGVRDAGSSVPLDTMRLWQREILAGTRVGPPRQLLSGPKICDSGGQITELGTGPQDLSCNADCVNSLAYARYIVDSLKAAGADMIKTYGLGREAYFVIAAEARRVGIPFGGHIHGKPERMVFPDTRPGVSVLEASDSGAAIIDHILTSGGLDTLCVGRAASVERCQPVVERFRRNGTWWVPTMGIEIGVVDEPGEQYVTYMARLNELIGTFRSGAAFQRTWFHDSARVTQTASSPIPGSPARVDDFLRIAHRMGLPILAGSDSFLGFSAGFALHAELAVYVAEGLTPLEALQTATLNPAKFLHGTDSLGTVAPGKLADLVVLDADPLEDITNTTLIRAVVANGRYFDRAALDQLLVAVQAKAK